MSVLRTLLCTETTVTNNKNEERIVKTEREVLTELIELYSNLPCLWDFKSEDYKSREKKNQAWSLLNEVHKKFDPDSTNLQTKIRVDRMKTAYQKEVRKVKISKQNDAADQIHKPILWYYPLMSFLNKETGQSIGAETLTSDDDSQKNMKHKIRRNISTHHNTIEQKNQKHISIAQEHIFQRDNKRENSFGIYLGEQLNEVSETTVTNNKNEERIVMTEREVLTELIELYSNLPCLWDYKSEDYKSREKKNQAWSLLNEVHKKIDPDSTNLQTKIRVDRMKTGYQREVRKVKISKQNDAADQIHKPILWYYPLMSFLNKETGQSIGAETLTSDDDSQKNMKHKVRRKNSTNHNTEQKNEKHIFQWNNKRENSFGIYLGEQLNEVNKFQCQIAEKIISEIIFLARTGKLKYNSKIETPPTSHTSVSSPNNYQCSLTPSPHVTNPLSSPDYVQESPSPPHFLSISPDLIKP